MKVINTISKFTNIFTKVFAYVSALAVLFNVVIILANVIMRAFGNAIVGTEELYSMSEVVLIFLALGYTQYNGGLVHVCFFMKKLPGISPVVMWAINQWVSFIAVSLCVWQTFVRVPLVKQVSTALLIPYKPFYVIIGIGFAVYAVACLFESIKATAAIFNKEVREDVVSHLPA
ncbi:MAG: TRAP transporter small permease [Oscillospiraceae bacterium]|nr:TRAP transporter small permease [Oscillospiraceae bacterium]MCD8099888.1 TRAP transporter small permease [Oscillospiraceae bacterium]